METHAREAFKGDILLLHDDGGRQAAEAQAIRNDPGVEPVGLVHIRIGFSELADELGVQGEHLGLALSKRWILMQVHGRVPAVDGSGFQADVNLGDGQLVRCSDDLVTQVRGAIQIVFDGECLKLVTVSVHETRFELLRAHVNTDKKLQVKFLLSLGIQGMDAPGCLRRTRRSITLAYEDTLRAMSCPGSAKTGHGMPKGTASG
ncbi:hypothetical protein D3C76_1274080 [compost metagenome]